MNRAPFFGSRNTIRPASGSGDGLGLTVLLAGGMGMPTNPLPRHPVSCPVLKMDLSIQVGSRFTMSVWARMQTPWSC